MNNLLYYATMGADLIGITFSILYTWQNLFVHPSDLKEKNAVLLKMMKTTAISTFISPFLMCLLSDSVSIRTTMGKTADLYSFITYSWLFSIIVSVFLLIIMIIRKNPLKADMMNAFRKEFNIALWSAAIGMVCTWLFS